MCVCICARARACHVRADFRTCVTGWVRCTVILYYVGAYDLCSSEARNSHAYFLLQSKFQWVSS